MTKPQILAELETLRDFVNDAGKAKLSTIAAAIQNLPEAPEPPVVPVAAQTVPVPVPAPEPVAVVVPPAPDSIPADRRSDERDPGQEEQISAEKLGLVGK